MKKGGVKYLLFVLLALSAFTLNYWLVEEISHSQDFQKKAEEKEEYLVTQIIDGDTIRLESGSLVRYLGIDTPELNPKTSLKPECWAEQAKEENRKLVFGKKVKLEKDVSDQDDYGRLLRYVWLENKLVNYQLLISGFAKTLTIPPNLRYQKLFEKGENLAKEKNLGLWGNCLN